MNDIIISVRDLCKCFGDFVAVDAALDVEPAGNLAAAAFQQFGHGRSM